jgi:hypothetical protein
MCASGLERVHSHSVLLWKYSETRALELIAYIVDHLKTAPDIEVWSIWLGEIDEEIAPIIKKIHFDELTVSILNEAG